MNKQPKPNCPLYIQAFEEEISFCEITRTGCPYKGINKYCDAYIETRRRYEILLKIHKDLKGLEKKTE